MKVIKLSSKVLLFYGLFCVLLYFFTILLLIK
jgi:hypothetical protein